METLEKRVKNKLMFRGFTPKDILESRPLIGATIEDTTIELVELMATEAEYWSKRCELVEAIWDNTPSYGDVPELDELHQEYRKFIHSHGNKKYR